MGVYHEKLNDMRTVQQLVHGGYAAVNRGADYVKGSIMRYITKNFISPNFGYEKLKSGIFEDLIDVFEDRMRNWFLLPVEQLLEISHCQIPAVALLITYFEGIEMYFSGKDSKHRSFEFFAKGFSKVFPVQHDDIEAPQIIARAIYNQARCGFVHDGIFRNRVFFSDIPSKPLIVSFPKRNGVLNTSQVESIVINPKLFCDSIRNHFEDYLKSLRDGPDTSSIRLRFKKIVKLKWALDEEDSIVGMTEKEFYTTEPNA